MNEQEMEAFLKIQSQLKSAYDEISLLSKKKPTDSLNPFKLKFINSILSRSNEILGKDYKPFPGEFEIFNVDEMPNNGDVVFILSHYLTSLEKLRCDNIDSDGYNWFWKIDDVVSDHGTNRPTIK